MKINQDNSAGHMTKMAAMTIYGKNPLKIYFPGTTGQILMTICMKHQRHKPFIICANYDPGLTSIYYGKVINEHTNTHKRLIFRN